MVIGPHTSGLLPTLTYNIETMLGCCQYSDSQLLLLLGEDSSCHYSIFYAITNLNGMIIKILN